MSIGAGELRERFTFQRRGLDTDGDRLGDWDVAGGFNMRARVLKHRTGGSEDVMQQRLQGKLPIVITVRDCANTRAMDNTWRAVDRASGRAFNIATVERTQTGGKPDRGFLDVVAVWDGSDGG